MSKWTDNLSAEVYARLCNCRSLKKDILELTQAKWSSMRAAGKDKDGYTSEDALVSILEHLDCNGQYFDLTADEYIEILEGVI